MFYYISGVSNVVYMYIDANFEVLKMVLIEKRFEQIKPVRPREETLDYYVP